MLLINEVSLGKCADFYKFDTELTAPPSGYNSVCGTTTETCQSDFKVSHQCTDYIQELFDKRFKPKYILLATFYTERIAQILISVALLLVKIQFEVADMKLVIT